jgi:hypothetical protein
MPVPGRKDVHREPARGPEAKWPST